MPAEPTGMPSTVKSTARRRSARSPVDFARRHMAFQYLTIHQGGVSGAYFSGMPSFVRWAALAGSPTSCMVTG